MGCDCVLPPPEFDLPPPPDPSLIWELLVESNEPLELFHKVRLQTCIYKPIFGFLDGENVYIPALLCLCFVILAIGCMVSACIYRKRRNQSKFSNSVNTSKTNSSNSTTVCTNGAHWSFDDCIPLGQTVPVVGYTNSSNGKTCQHVSPSKMFTSSNATNILQAQSIVTTNGAGALIRTLPKRSCLLQNPPFNETIGNVGTATRLHQSHFSSQCCLGHVPIHFRHQLSENSTGGYCTLSSHQPQYEEIGTLALPSFHHRLHEQSLNAPHYATNPICCEHAAVPVIVQTSERRFLQRQDSDTIFEDLSENLRLQQERKPPPNSAPPPVPKLIAKPSIRPSRHSNSTASFTDELASSSDVELEQLTQLGVPLPHDVLNHRQQSHGDLHGRDSAYGGSIARIQAVNLTNWHSPPQALRFNSNVRSPVPSSSSGHSSQHNSPPSTSNVASAQTVAPSVPSRLIHTKTTTGSTNQHNMTYV